MFFTGIILALFILFSVDLIDLEGNDGTWVKALGFGGAVLLAVIQLAIPFLVGLIIGAILKMAICHFFKMLKEKINEGY